MTVVAEDVRARGVLVFMSVKRVLAGGMPASL